MKHYHNLFIYFQKKSRFDGVKNTYFILIFSWFMILNQALQSQTFTTSVAGTTAWGTASNWVVSNPGGCANQYSAPPPSTTTWWPNCPVDIVITRDMVLSANFITGGYVRSLTIQNGATLTINNLTLQNNNFAGGGILNV